MLRLRCEDRFALLAATLSMTILRVRRRDAGATCWKYLIASAFSVAICAFHSYRDPCDNSDHSPGIP